MVERAVAASETHCASAARDLLARGNAVDAVVAGVAAAAAESEGVLLGPVQLLVGGGGAGLLAFDGRTRQPGRGVPRPRGFLAGESIPDTARVAVPLLPATLATAVASAGTASLLAVFRPALALARARSPERAGVLEALTRRGVPAFVDGFVADELLAVAGRATRGLLTADDLRSVRPRVTRCHEKTLAPGGMLLAPWLGDTICDASFTQVVAAVDGRGMIAVACYEAPPGGIAIRALGLKAPANAAPVMRGETRVAPGEPRPAPAPVVLRTNRGVIDLAVGIAALAQAQAALGSLLAVLQAGGEIVRAVAEAAGGRGVALLREGAGTRTLGF